MCCWKYVQVYAWETTQIKIHTAVEQRCFLSVAGRKLDHAFGEEKKQSACEKLKESKGLRRIPTAAQPKWSHRHVARMRLLYAAFFYTPHPISPLTHAHRSYFRTQTDFGRTSRVTLKSSQKFPNLESRRIPPRKSNNNSNLIFLLILYLPSAT